MSFVLVFSPLILLGLFLYAQHKAKLDGKEKAEYQHMSEVIKNVEGANKALLAYKHDRFKRDQLLNKYSRPE